MFEKSIYKKVDMAKNGQLIPVLQNNRTVESKYNPQIEAQRIIDSLDNEYKFFILIGIGSGILLQNLLKKFPQAIFICMELSQDDLDFLAFSENNLELSKIYKNPQIILCALNEIQKLLLENYLPVKYGDLKIIEQRGWINENHDYLPQIYENIQKAINIISADYSTQAHFGKIWINNIMNNLKLINQQKKITIKTNTSKTAAVIAAGPSLDKTLNTLINHPDDYFIIATDTAYQTLIKNKITPHIVVSLDGQIISKNHFIHKEIHKDTVFLFDLTANYNSVKYLTSQKAQISFFQSGHPFCKFAQQFSNVQFTSLFAGSGTVTIAATDFAIMAGFKKIEVFGADFSYHHGKTYTKGTYLDILYNSKSNRLSGTEFLYDKLMFRTNLNKADETQNENNSTVHYTTKILEAYKQSFEHFVIQNGFTLHKENYCYFLENKNNHNNYDFGKIDFNFESFCNFLKQCNPKSIEIPLLPLAAWIKTNYKKNDFNEILNIAHSYIVSYNI